MVHSWVTKYVYNITISAVVQILIHYLWHTCAESKKNLYSPSLFSTKYFSINNFSIFLDTIFFFSFDFPLMEHNLLTIVECPMWTYKRITLASFIFFYSNPFDHIFLFLTSPKQRFLHICFLITLPEPYVFWS